MKTNLLHNWMIVCVSALTATTAIRASADDSTTVRPEKNCTGTVISVDTKEETLALKWFLFNKKFNLGNTCAYVLLDKNSGTASDLRPGEKVRVGYQDADGVYVANRIEQEPMTYEGMVTAIDPVNRTLTVNIRALDKTFQIANDCNVVLRDDKSGTLDDIQVGNHVTVTYEVPNNKLSARQIAQTSTSFTGALTAIDLDDRTVKARALFGTKKFILADNCAIVIDNKTGGELSDLKPNDELTFSYDEINGVNVANRIANAKAAPATTATASNQ